MCKVKRGDGRHRSPRERSKTSHRQERAYNRKVFVFAVYKCEPVPLGVSNGGLCAIQPHLSPKNSNSEVTTMTITDKAIKLFGFENPITITIAVLEEQGKNELAEALFNEVCAYDEEEEDE